LASSAQTVAENPDLSATVCADEAKPFEMEWA